MQIWAIAIEWLITHTPEFLRRLLVNPLKKRARQWIANKVRFGKGYVESTYAAGTIGKTSSPLYCATIRQDIDNRSPEDLRIQKILVRVYINGVPYITMIRGKGEAYYSSLQPKEIDMYPSEFALAKDSKTVMRVNVFIPPYFSREVRMYIDLYGQIELNSSFGSFIKGISYQGWVDPGQWKQ